MPSRTPVSLFLRWMRTSARTAAAAPVATANGRAQHSLDRARRRGHASRRPHPQGDPGQTTIPRRLKLTNSSINMPGMAIPPRSTMGRRRSAPNFDAREHLLDVAIALFAERGIANTTVAQIANASGVTSAMVHYWFQTREKLLDAVVDERLAPAFGEIWAPVDADHDKPLALTQGIVQRMFDVTAKMPWLPSL